MMLGGGPGMFGGPTANASNAAAGLPFAGVPSELEEGARRILDAEPEVEPTELHFDPSATEPPLTLRALLRPERARLVLAVLLIALETVGALAGPLLTAIAIDEGVTEGRTSVVLAAAAVYVAAVVVTALANGARLSLTARIAERRLEVLRVRLFAHLQRLSIDFFTRERTGVLLSRMTSDVEGLSVLLQEGYVNLIVQSATVVLVTVVLITLSPLLALLLLALVVPVFVGLTWWFRVASSRAYDRVRERIADVLADLSEHLAGIRVVIAMDRRAANEARHERVVDRYRTANEDSVRIGATYGPAAELTGYVGQAGVLVIGGALVADGRLTVGELTAFVLYLTTFFAPIQQLVQLHNVYQQGTAARRKLADLLAERPAVPEAPDARDLPPLRGELRLEGVTFAYGDAPVLTDIDLHVPAGTTLAVVGPTGAGKSTLAKLVVRFHDPDRGRVLLDGHDLREVTLASLRSQLGVVPQEPFLFHGTLRDNLAFGRPEASDDEILEAADLVGLTDLIGRDARGLDAPVHERGVSLSAGERQLLALGRAMVARPRVLVLDEATSNLDLEAERQVERALDAVLEGRTAVIVAHRLSTVRRADLIAVIEGGRLVELGDHHELVEQDGRYAAMHRSWVAAGGAGGVPGAR